MTPTSARLPWGVDAAALRADVEGLAPEEWIPHFNTAYYAGDWSGVPLRSVGGEAGRLYPNPTASGEFDDTPVLARCPGVQALLATLRCPLLAVRFLRLGPDSRIREHRDLNLGFDDGEVRLHVPVTTDPAVEFLLDRQPVRMEPGEVWYLDLNLRHSVVNAGTEPRVHLVVDCVVDDWLGAVLAEAIGHSRPEKIIG